MGQSLHPALTILIACAPAMVATWWGRELSRDLNDPALPERLLANRRRTGAAFGVSVGLLIFFGLNHLVWSLPLLVITRMVAAFPIRKVLYNETWGIAAYLSFFLRLVLVVFGFWILVATMPLVSAAAGSRDVVVGAALGAIAVAWSAWYSAIFSFVLRARPVATPSITSRFAQLVKACELPVIQFEQVELRGGVFANAVAVPSLRRPAVVVTDTLLTRFDEDEVTAILAHELAHHEYYNPRRIRRMNIVTYALILLGAVLAPVVRATVPQALTASLLTWPVVMIVAMALRAQHRQKHETESDLRAVALTGDGEALVRALTKLHAFARLPRRWEPEFERRATHPSLARRIQAIRNASGAAPKAVATATFTDAANTASVTFRDECLEWAEGTSTTHAIAYGHLSDLRIDARSKDAPKLVAVDAGKRRWTLALQSHDVARVQELLDIVDVRLGKVSPPPAVSAVAVRALAWLTIAVGMLASQFSLLVCGLAALMRPSPVLAAAAGMSAMTAAALTVRDPGFRGFGHYFAWIALALFSCGAVLLALAFVNRAATKRDAIAKEIGALAVCAALAWIAIVLSSSTAFDLHRGVRAWPAATILTLACTAALGVAPLRSTRMAFVPVALAGLIGAYVGSVNFLDRFVHDPFIVQAPRVTTKSLKGSMISEFSVEFEPSSVSLSPAGQYVAIASEDEREQSSIHAGPAGRTLTEFMADDAVFLDESRLLLVERQPRASVLRVVDLAAENREQWQLSVPVSWGEMSIDRASRTWRLTGQNAAGDLVSAEGRVGEKTIQHSKWKSPTDSNRLEILGVARGTVVALEHVSRPSLMRSSMWMLWLPFASTTFRSESRMWSVADSGRSQVVASGVELTCHSSVVRDGPAACAAFDGMRTRLFSIDPASAQPVAMASLDGRFYPHGNIDFGWVAGWWGDSPILLNPATREVIRPPATADSGVRPHQLAVGETVMATVSWNDGDSLIRVYQKPPNP